MSESLRLGVIIQPLLHRGVGEPLAANGDRIALLGLITAPCKEFGRVVARINRHSRGAPPLG